jgi:hypothetical protein
MEQALVLLREKPSNIMMKIKIKSAKVSQSKLSKHFRSGSVVVLRNEKPKDNQLMYADFLLS